MIFRIYPTKDTFISNALYRAVPQTASNYGYAETLQVFKISGISGATGPSSGSQLARALFQFSTASLDSFLSSGYSQNRGRFYYLHAKHETTRETLPSSFDVTVAAVSGAWDEGTGMDVSNMYDLGYANWWKRSSTQYWVNRGGDTYPAISTVVHFDTGYEDLNADVTSLFSSWASGTIPNDGICVSMTASIEADSVYRDYYLKSFYSRHSQWPDRRPYVEVRWNDFIGDDRSRMSWGKTGSVYLYNTVDGQYQDLSIGVGSLIVRLSDSSGTIMSVTASHTGMTGIYSASVCLPTGSYSGSIFYDSWGSGSFSFLTGTITFSSSGPSQSQPKMSYTARATNIRDTYDTDEVVRFDVTIRRKGFLPSVVATGSTNTPIQIVERAFYAIENDSTRERIVPFGTGSLQHTRLSYDANGNYFLFPMSNLHSGEVYRLIFLIQRDGIQQVIDNDIKFRIR